jgi:pyruvate/2-oxoglutarate/acetoin dehydrogenase E1 component
MAQMTMIQAITDALRSELKNDSNVLVLLKDYKKNSAKTVYLIHLLLNQESAVLRSVLD